MTTTTTIHLELGDDITNPIPGYVNVGGDSAIRSEHPDILDQLGRRLIDAADRLRVAQSNTAERAAARAVNRAAATECFGNLTPEQIAERFTGEFRVSGAA